MKNRRFFFLLFLLSLSFFQKRGPAQTPFPETAKKRQLGGIAVLPRKHDYKVGQEFFLELVVETGDIPLKEVYAVINFDSSRVAVVGGDRGIGFPDIWHSTQSYGHVLQNAIILKAFLRTPGLYQSGTVASLHMVALNPGEVTFSFQPQYTYGIMNDNLQMFLAPHESVYQILPQITPTPSPTSTPGETPTPTPTPKWTVTPTGTPTPGPTSTPIPSPTPVSDARFLWQDIPGSINAGAGYIVRVALENSGTTTWNSSDSFRLGSRCSPQKDIWGIEEVNLLQGETVSPGKSKTFQFPITAPAVTGKYSFQWQMIQGSANWFGEKTPFGIMIIVSSGPTPTMTPTPLPDLAVESMWWNPLEPTTTDDLALDFKARNWGGVPSPGCRFLVEVDGKSVSTGNLPSIDAGGGEMVIPGIPLGKLGEGERKVDVTLDSQNTVTEANEENNSLSGTITVIRELVERALILITPYGDVWGSSCRGIPPFGNPVRWAWLGTRYNPLDGSLPLKGDFNGDGMEDLLQITPSGDVWGFTREYDTFVSTKRWGWLGFYYDEMDGNEGLLPLTGDFNGDGLCDVLQITFYGDVWVALSNGTRFNPPSRWGWLGFKFKRGTAGKSGMLPMAGDLDGDCRCDLLQTTVYGDVWGALSNGASFDSPKRWGWLGFFYRPLEGWLPALSDLDGDGRDDLLQFTPWGEVWTAKSNGSNFENPMSRGALGFKYDETAGYLPLSSDVDTDGLTDLIQITPSGDPWVAINHGSGFDPPRRWGFLNFTFSRQQGNLPLFLSLCEPCESLNIDMVSIPAGTFTMGARDDGDDDRFACYDEYPRHQVTLSHYEIGKYEVTNGQYCMVLNYALSKGYLRNASGGFYTGGEEVYHKGMILLHMNRTFCQIEYERDSFRWRIRDGYSMMNHPVLEVSWYGAVAFCNWLSEMEGLSPAYNLTTWNLVNKAGGGYRLPTEAEWERAAAWGGSKHWIYGFESDTLTGKDSCNYGGPDHNYVNPLDIRIPCTSPVGWFNGINISPNGNIHTLESHSPVGCYDMSGNTHEWCHDWYGTRYYKGGDMIDPTGPASGTCRVFRGGTWLSYAMFCRTADRSYTEPTGEILLIGFRVCR